MRVEPFTIDVADEVLTGLRARIRRTRWPEPAPADAWEQGVDRGYRAGLGGYAVIHFVRARAPKGDGFPLVLTHGWPGTFVEMLPLVPLLTDPQRHGIDAPPFDLVATRTRSSGPICRTWRNAPYTGAGTPPLSDEERAWLAQVRERDTQEAGYKAIQSTRPQTLGYGLNDSPAGLATWILEKWRSWSDSGGDLDATFSRDVLLTTLTIFWATQTITSSMRDYIDNRADGYVLGPGEHVDVPTGVAVFAHHHVPDPPPPLAWAARLHRVARWTSMPAGGHFPATEQPELLARDVAAFFAGRLMAADGRRRRC